eukprot:UN25069
MLTLTEYDNYNLIALQASDRDGLECREFSTKFRAETRGYIYFSLFLCLFPDTRTP